MDATQKRKALVVAIIHFATTVFVFWKILHFSSFLGPIESPWHRYWTMFLCLLQPQFWIAPTFAIFLTPVWSICFGRLYVVFFNWLNHFPVLGKRVF